MDSESPVPDHGPTRATRSHRAALVVVGTLLLSGCSQVDQPSEDDADAVAFRDSCTEEGQHVLDSSAEQTIEDAPQTEQGALTVALRQISSNEPSAYLELSATGAEESPAEFDGELGDDYEYQGVRITITSICASEARFDVEET